MSHVIRKTRRVRSIQKLITSAASSVENSRMRKSRPAAAKSSDKAKKPAPKPAHRRPGRPMTRSIAIPTTEVSVTELQRGFAAIEGRGGRKKAKAKPATAKRKIRKTGKR